MLLLRAIENDSHDGLPGSNRAIGFDMDLVDTDGLSFCHEGIENILAKVFALNDDFLLLGVSDWVKGGQSVDTIGFFANS